MDASAEAEEHLQASCSCPSSNMCAFGIRFQMIHHCQSSSQDLWAERMNVLIVTQDTGPSAQSNQQSQENAGLLVVGGPHLESKKEENMASTAVKRIPLRTQRDASYPNMS